MWRLIWAVHRADPVTKKCYVGLVKEFGSDLHAVYWRAEATTEKLVEREAKLSELDLNAQLFVEEADQAGGLQDVWTSKKGSLSQPRGS